MKEFMHIVLMIKRIILILSLESQKLFQFKQKMQFKICFTKAVNEMRINNKMPILYIINSKISFRINHSFTVDILKALIKQQHFIK